MRRRSATIPNVGKPSYFVESKGFIVSKRKIITSKKYITNSYIAEVGPTISVLVFKPNPKRISILIQNRSLKSIYLDFDKLATTDNSFEVFCQGSYDESMNPSLGSIYILGSDTLSAPLQKINVMETYTS